jgi:hypothetical protein
VKDGIGKHPHIFSLTAGWEPYNEWKGLVAGRDTP